MSVHRKSLLIVGAFPRPGSRRAVTVFGGVFQSCQRLLQSSLPEQVRLILVDSTQASVPPPGFFIRLLRACLRSFVFLWRYERTRPEAVLIFSSAGASFIEKSLYAAYASLRGSKVLFFLRDGGFMQRSRQSARYRRLARLLLAVNDVVLCQTAVWRTFFIHEIGVPPDRCAVIENWTVSKKELAIGDARSYEAGGKVRLLYMGWIEEQKGILDLLEAFRRLLEDSRTDDIELTLAGKGSALSRCQQWVTEKGISSHVRFLGWISGSEKERALKESDIFVLPSYFEGLSNAVLEAMAAGLPVVVTRVGGLPDVVRHEQEGLLVEAGDVAALHSALARLAVDGQLREALGRAARRAASRFDVEIAVEKLVALIDCTSSLGSDVGCSQSLQ